MKLRLLFAVLIATGLFACNETKREDASHVHSQDSVVHSTSEKESQLVLDDGKKWKLDEATRNNIDSIKKTVHSASSQQKDYAKVATDLESDVNRLVSQCRMSGRDHDMLHLWLENFLTDLKELKTASKEEQPIAFAKIETLLKEFGDYFE